MFLYLNSLYIRMNKSNFLFLFMAVLFALTILPMGVSALTYDSVKNNGTWLQYTSGLDSDYYATDLYQASENRDFSIPVDFNTTSSTEWVSHNIGVNWLSVPKVCETYWCADRTARTNTHLVYSPEVYATTINTDYVSAPYSLQVTYHIEQEHPTLVYFNFFSAEEISAGSLVTFSYKLSNLQANQTLGVGGTINGDFVDSSSVFYLANSGDWNKVSFVMPDGSDAKLTFQFYSEAQVNSPTLLIDDIEITNNNTGTFRTSIPSSCHSISSCSNIKTNLPSADLGNLYWVVDYVAGASCSWSKNGISQGGMTEGTSGMYYAKINEYVESGHSEDVNLSATCIKSPYSTKSFFVTPKIYKYNLISNGDFSSGIPWFYWSSANQCFSDWCFLGHANPYYGKIVNTADPTSQEGSVVLGTIGEMFVDTFGNASYLRISNSSAVSSGNFTFWSLEENQSEASIEFVYFIGKMDSTAIFSWGYVNDSNSYSSVGSISGSHDFNGWEKVNYDIPVGANRVAFRTSVGSVNHTIELGITSVTSSVLKQESSLTASNNLVNNFGLRGQVYLFSSDYVNAFGNDIITGDCTLTVAGTDYAMAYNSSTGNFEYSRGFISDESYTITHTCEDDSFNSQTDSYSIDIGTSATSGLNAEPIQNISSISLSDTNNAITLNSVSNTGNLIFRARTGESSYTFTTFFSNNDRSGKQYFVYTSSDGVNWTFNDSLTFGATNSTPLQKIWNTGSNNFDYSFSNTLSQDVWVYYKLVYSEIPKFWGAIGGSVDWINVNPSQVVSESSGKHFYDLFQNSSPTKINSYTKEQYPDLTSADLTTGFYLQFNAYAETPIELKVGYKVGSSVATETVYLTTGWNRYSVLIDPNDNEAHLLIKSDSTTSARVYISDYALIPASYFAQRLEIGGSGVLVRGGVSYQTLTELAPFNVQTSFYDREENLSKIYYQIILDGNIIKTYEYNLNQDSLDTSKITYINKELSEVIDYSGNGSINSPLKDITIKAILVNSSDQNVSEQFKTLKFLQFPYYPTDIELSLVSLNNKVGTSPKIQFLINTLNPKAIIGLELKIYDVNHSVADPNYSETIYSDEIGCSNYIYCAKNILVDEWAWEQATTYTVRLTTLVNTEATTYINNLTSKFISVSATSGTLETARVLQVYERRTEANKSYYTQVEPIPLVFQARDDLLRNLQDDILPYIQIDYYADHVTKDAQDIKFYPIKHYYDDATGYNYWFWNRYFYLDNGSLFDTNSQIDFKVTIEVSNATISNENNYSLGNKCLTYPTKYSPSTFLMDWGGRSLLDDFDCVANTPSPIVLYEGASHRIDINSSYIPKSDQSQNVLCVRANEPFNPINDFGDDFACAVLITKSEEQIDTIKVTIGNDASDVGITSEAKQYLNFEFSIDDLLFNDVWATATTLTAPSSVESVGNIGDLLYLGFSEIIPSAMEGYDDFTDWFSYASFQKNTAFDTNFFKNIHYLSSVAFFKVRGLKVINQYDYLNYDSDVRTIPPSKFLAYAQSKNLYVPIKKSQIEIYGSNLEPIRTEIINSPLVISLRPSQTGYKEDANGIRIVAQDIQNIKIEITSDMTSANQTKTNRIYLPMVFGYAVPFNPSWFDVMAGVGDAIQNPIPVFTKFFTNYWFSIVLFLAFALIVSLIYANLRSRNGGTTIINSIPFSRGDSL